MNTQSHAIVNLFLLNKAFAGTTIEHQNNINIPIVLGSILPDLPIVFFFVWYTWIVPTPQRVIWGTLYFTKTWQMFFDLFNSIPLYLLLAISAYLLSQKTVLIFALANLLHFVEDFFVHQEDGHAHFFPLSDYKFMSPVSYWDSRYFGQYFSTFELIVTLVLSVCIFRYVTSWWGKGALILANLFLIFNHSLWFMIFSLFR